jgi:hypothetical protein
VPIQFDEEVIPDVHPNGFWSLFARDFPGRIAAIVYSSVLNPASVITLSETESCQPARDSYHNAIPLAAVKTHPSYSYVESS